MYDRPIKSEIRFGALCWNQYTDWPAVPEGRDPSRARGLLQSLDLGSRLSHRRLRGRSNLRGLPDASRLGAGNVAHPRRADGGCQSIPQPGAYGEDGNHTRPHLWRPGVPRHWDRRGTTARRGRSASTSARLPGERLRWLREALPVMRGMLRGEVVSSRRANTTPRTKCATTHRLSKSTCRC